MAMPKAALELEARMAENYNKRKELENEWIAMKAEFDSIIDRDRLAFKLGIKTPEDLENLKKLVGSL
jgi:hypothetical protein